MVALELDACARDGVSLADRALLGVVLGQHGRLHMPLIIRKHPRRGHDCSGHLGCLRGGVQPGLDH